MSEKFTNDITVVTRIDRITKDALVAYAERRHLPFATAIREVLQRALKTVPQVGEKKSD